MFSSLRLENFKAFGEKVEIPFAPITLIFGENSAGKSSILQALSLLKQTRESREAGVPLLPRVEKGIVDLGSFHDFIFDHDLDRSLSIGVKVELTARQSYGKGRQHLLRAIAGRKVGLQVNFKRPTAKAEVGIADLIVFLGDGDKPIAAFESIKTSLDLRRQAMRYVGFGREPIPNVLRAAKCKWITADESFWKPLFDFWNTARSKVLPRLEKVLKEKKISGVPMFFRLDRAVDSEQDGQEYRNRLKDMVSFYSKDFTLDALRDRLLSQQLGIVIGLDGFVPIMTPPRSSLSELTDEDLTESFHERSRVNTITADIGRIAVIAGRVVDEELRKLFPMGPARRSPERWYIFTGTSPQDVGYQGDSMPDFLFRNPDVVKKVNSWLHRLEIGYRLETRLLGPRIRDLFEVRLTDTRRKTSVKVGLPDVGFGVSQLLPFIVQALATEGQIISIEQPEVHVHPRLQADIGDLLAECAKKLGNQFLIETHSEHLVLRLQRLIRDGVLKPEDVSIIYVSRGSEGSRVQRLALDSEGDFIDEWPGGFFPERLRELN
jgi:predicted ATPase